MKLILGKMLGLSKEVVAERDRLREWVNGLKKVWWRDGEIQYRGEYGYALFDCSGLIIDHYPTAYEALTAYLKDKAA